MTATRHEELRDQWLEYHREHPKVWDAFVRISRELKRRGFKTYGAKGVIEAIRWHTDTPDVDGASTFKINNNFAPFYARAAMRRHADLRDFFRIREQTSRDKRATGLPPLTPADFPEVPLEPEQRSFFEGDSP